MPLSELREVARGRGLPVSGTKTELVERLRGADDAPPAPVDEPPVPEQVPEENTAPARDESFFEVAVPAVRPDRVDQEWLDKCARQVLRRALADGLVPCGDVEHVDTVDGGKRFVFRVPVR